jgi:DNA-3-methyladenine glycosylase I
MQKRCGWVNLKEQIYVDYHDKEWGKPLLDDNALFELFSLETQAAGLSWLTILKKRDGYKKAFEGFDLKNVFFNNRYHYLTIFYK